MADRVSISDHSLAPLNGGAPEHAVIVLHGRGGDGKAMLEMGELLRQALPDAEILLPTALLPLPGRPGGRQWFDEDAADEELITAGVAEAARSLDAFIGHVAATRRLDAGRIALVGYSQGAMVSLYAAPRRSDPVAGVVAFAGRLFGGRSLPAAGCSNFRALLLHGGEDAAVPPFAALEARHILQDRGDAVEAVIYPDRGHGDILAIDGPAMAAALWFLRKAFGLSLGSMTAIAARPKIKLVVWDLDDTLWRGTLAENDEVVLDQRRSELVRQFNRHGVVSSICSKNDPAIARARLKAFGLWDQFVFPRIDFAPKGPALADIIADMQLRPANVLFVDDNVHNLEEVKYLIPEIHVLDARSAECDAMLEGILKDNEHQEKSRLDEYRALERKQVDRARSKGSRDDFLRSCDIHLALAWRADVMDFQGRIEELINRSNQLNFTGSRVPEGSMAAYLATPALNECFAVFVWDKYGYHGLIGFASVHMPELRLDHLAFSCRIMDMGIENWVVARLLAQFPGLVSSRPVTVVPHMADWITVESFDNPAIRAFILGHEKDAPRQRAEIVRFLLACQSGSLAHFSGLREVSQIDNSTSLQLDGTKVDNGTRSLSVTSVAHGTFMTQAIAPLLVLGMAVDLWNCLWPDHLVGEIDHGLYGRCVDIYCRRLQAERARILVIRMPHALADSHYLPKDGITRQRHHAFSRVWTEAEARYAGTVDILDVDAFGDAGGCIDIGHYKVALLKEIGDRVRAWAFRQVGGLAEEEAQALLGLI